MDSELGPPWRGGGIKSFPSKHQTQQELGSKREKGTEFGRGRCCSQREEEQLCPAQLEHFLGLLESCGQPGLFIFKKVIHAWVTDHLGRCGAAPGSLPLLWRWMFSTLAKEN